MKRVIILLLALAVALSVCACSKKGADSEGSIEEWEENGGATKEGYESLVQCRDNIKEKACILGVAYLGERTDTDESIGEFLNKQSYWEDFQLLLEISPDRTVEKIGNELYIIVPLEGTKVTVYSCEIDLTTGDAIKTDELFVSEEGEPFYLQGNMSEPSFVVVAEKDGKKVEYVPCVDTETHKLIASVKEILDITPVI